MWNKIQILIISFGVLAGQTESEIKQIKKMVQQSGMNNQQVIEAARGRGYSSEQIQAVINRSDDSAFSPKKNKNEKPKVQREKKEGSTEIINDKTNVESFVNETPEESIKLETKKNEKKSSLAHYGYEIFKRDPAIFQETSVGIVDPSYLIGPGDEIIVMLWGQTQFREVLKVDREGFIFIPEIGQVFVNGLNLLLMESKLFRVFSQSYASLNPQNQSPTTFLDVSIGKLRPLRIQVLGEVSQPGAYTISPSATLFSSLYYFNGPTKLGSLRDVQLIRNGKKIASIDFYNYLLTGTKPNDQKLQLDDVVFIPPRLKTVKIRGEVNRPGIYELKPDETIKDLVSMAGGLKVSAYLDRAQIDRIIPFDKRGELGIDRMFKDINLEDALKPENEFKLQDADQVQIFSILDLRTNVAIIDGSVARPGGYDLGDSLRISDLIKKAGGITGDAYLGRIDIVRLNPDFTEKLIKLNLGEILDGFSENDIFLKGLDRIKVYGMGEMIDKKTVSIEGYVKRPGRFLLQENMTAYDLIFMAGGFLDKDFLKNVYLDRADLIRLSDDGINKELIKIDLKNILQGSSSKNNFILKAGDIIRIFNKNIFISVKPISINGEVRNPGDYNLKNNMTIKDLILEAGGLLEMSYDYKVEIARVNIEKKRDEINYAKIISLELDSQFNILKINEKSNGEKSLYSFNDFKLFPYDIVFVRPNPLLKNRKIITVKGEVRYPGKYIILSAEDKVNDIIKRAGGLTHMAYTEASQFIRNGKEIKVSLKEIMNNNKFDFKVQDGDVLIINTFANTVSLKGEVNDPGFFKYEKDKRLKHYLRLAGGLTSNASRGDIWVKYPNGKSKKYKITNFLSPKIIDGSSIIIGKVDEKEPFDTTEFLKEFSSIVASFAQVIALFFLAN